MAKTIVHDLNPTMSLSTPVSQAYRLLYFGFILLPIIAGIDKLTGILVNWDQYLAAPIIRILPIAPHTFMLIVGAIEIAAGLLVFVNPRVGSYVVCAWLGVIIVNLLMTGYYDIALRDFGLAIGALALGCLSQDVENVST